jgi:D-alanyl-D-alanine carboxypeptidase
MAVDAQTGKVLRELNPDVATYPASLTKMMTLYLTFEALKQGSLQLDQFLPVSAKAASLRPNRLGLISGDMVSVRDLILAVVAKSANDATTVLAEGIAGGEIAFAQMMTAKARQLGMQQTYYRNATGLPDPDQRTTARDTVRLAIALYHQFPREYRYFATREFEFRHQLVRSDNRLLQSYPGADPIAAGPGPQEAFNFAASATRGGRALIAVVIGSASERSADQQMMGLLDIAFADLGVRNQEETSVPTAPAQQKTAPVGTGFAINSAGVFLTNYHVIKGCSSIRVRTDAVGKDALIIAIDERNDLVVLRVRGATVSPATFRDGKGIRPGDGAVALGFPYAGLLASTPQVTPGAVSALAGLLDDSRYLQFTAPVQPGSSGGPLLDLSGNVVGVVTGRINELAVAEATGSLPQNINFAIKSGIVREFLDANRVAYLNASSDTKLDPADVAERATKSTVLVECSKS